jgi:hypothetical protein
MLISFRARYGYGANLSLGVMSGYVTLCFVVMLTCVIILLAGLCFWVHFVLGYCCHTFVNINRVKKSLRMTWMGHVTCMGVGRWRGAYRVLVGKTEGMRTLGRSRCRKGNNNEMGLKPVGTVSTGLI